MRSKEKEALERIKGLVKTQVVKEEGEDAAPPSFLDIYNLACVGLGECGSSHDAMAINSVAANLDNSAESLSSN
jgi:hypothetical protein